MVRVSAVPVAFLLVFTFTAELGAQSQRYELGRCLRVFEDLWEKTPGEEARKRTEGSLNQAVTAFFTFRFGEAGRAIDQARFALDDVNKPTPTQHWAESLAIFPATRLVDAEKQTPTRSQGVLRCAETCRCRIPGAREFVRGWQRNRYPIVANHGVAAEIPAFREVHEGRRSLASQRDPAQEGQTFRWRHADLIRE